MQNALEEPLEFTDITCLHCGDKTKVVWKGEKRFETCFKCGWLEELEHESISEIGDRPENQVSKPARAAEGELEVSQTPAIKRNSVTVINGCCNEVFRVNNHAEMIIGKHRAFIDLDDVCKIETDHWAEHPRGPITFEWISKKPRRRKYTLMAMRIYGKAVSFIDGNRYDLRRPNVANKQLRIGAALRRTKKGDDTGIFMHKGRWSAGVRIRGKLLRKFFGIKKYGNERARQMARDARKQMVSLAYNEATGRLRQFSEFPVLRFNNEDKNAPLPEPKGLLYLAKLYAERERLGKEMIPHLHRMLLLGGGRMPKTETKKNLGRINLYEGNSEYRDAVIDDVSSPYLHEPTE